MTKVEFCSQLLSFERHLLKFAYRLTQSKPDAWDLVQDTFLKALVNREKFVNDGNFKAWTFTILRNAFINNYRRSFRQNTMCDRTPESLCFNRTEESGSYEPDSVYSELEIKHYIEQLNDMVRLPLKMHIDGYKYKEIASELNLNIGTVKSRIFQSRKQLKYQLKG